MDAACCTPCWSRSFPGHTKMLKSADNLRARLYDGESTSRKKFEAKIVELQNLAQRKEVEAKAAFMRDTLESCG